MRLRMRIGASERPQGPINPSFVFSPLLSLLSSLPLVLSSVSWSVLPVLPLPHGIFPPFGYLPPQIAKSHSFTHSTRFDLFFPFSVPSARAQRSKRSAGSGQRSAVHSARVRVRVELNCSLLKSISCECVSIFISFLF